MKTKRDKKDIFLQEMELEDLILIYPHLVLLNENSLLHALKPTFVVLIHIVIPSIMLAATIPT